MHYSLPVYKIEVEVGDDKSGHISSALHDANPFEHITNGDEMNIDHDCYETAIDTLEALILAHACEGIDISSPAYVAGINSAVDAVLNHLQ